MLQELAEIERKQEFISFGYIHNVEKDYNMNIATELILIIMDYINCILDVYFDSNCPTKDAFSIFDGKSLQAQGNDETTFRWFL